LHLYFNYFSTELIFSYNLNVNTNLDLYYNTLLELLYESNGYNYGLSYDIILNKGMYLLDSNRINTPNSTEIFNRYSLTYLQNLYDSEYDFLDRIRIAKKIGYRTNFT
jgi:hypothetical protein